MCTRSLSVGLTCARSAAGECQQRSMFRGKRVSRCYPGVTPHKKTGASGVLRSLLDCGAIGMITTHDLALTAVADALSPRAANVHFEDQFEGGEIQFDYRVKPGPVTRSNALALMRAVGLDVDQT